MIRFCWALAALATICACVSLEPPVVKRIPFEYSLHNQTLVDQYMWLENADDPDVIAYINAENAYGRNVSEPLRALKEELYAEFAHHSTPTDATGAPPALLGCHFYYSQYKPDKEYPIWYRRRVAGDCAEAAELSRGCGNVAFERHRARQPSAMRSRDLQRSFTVMHEAADPEEELVLDENEYALAQHPYFDVGIISPSPDSSLLAFTVDTVGSDSFTLRFRNLTSGQMLPDTIENVYYDLVWAADSSAVFYNTIDQKLWQPMAAYRHVIGQPVNSDVCVYSTGDPSFTARLLSTSSEHFLLLYVQGQLTNEVWYLNSSTPLLPFTRLFPAQENVKSSVEHRLSRFYILTNIDGAFNNKLVMVPAANTSTQNWAVLLPHDPNTHLDAVQVFMDHMVVWRTRDTLQRISVYALADDGAVVRFVSDVSIPGSEQGRTGLGLWYTLHNLRELNYEYAVQPLIEKATFNSHKIVFSYTTFTTPIRYYCYDIDRDELVLQYQTIVADYNASLYGEQRLEAPAPAGDDWPAAASPVLVPITLVYNVVNSSALMSGESPLLLWGYGAYGGEVGPEFNSEFISLLDRGVVVALAHIRGGDIRGAQWYEYGRTQHKNNTFSDFAAAARYLISSRWCSPHRLAMFGRSAGGLLMGSMMTIARDLATIVWAQVPFLDVIRDMINPDVPWVQWEWCEWGNPTLVNDFSYMRRYDPYINLPEPEEAAQTLPHFPHLIVQTGLADSIVSYHEGTKYVAKLRAAVAAAARAANASGRAFSAPDVLLYVNDAGHMGASADEHRRDQAYQYAVVLSKLDAARRIVPNAHARAPESSGGVVDPDKNQPQWTWPPNLAVVVALVVSCLVVIALFALSLIALWRRSRRHYGHLGMPISPSTSDPHSGVSHI